MDALRIPKLTLLFFLAASMAPVRAGAQVPVSPTQRPITGGGSASVGVAPKAPAKQVVKTITYITLSEARQWTSSDGKALLAKLIAFEGIVIESTDTTSAAQPAAMPTTPPTVVKDGRVRLLLNGKAVELALDRLSTPDREYIEKIQAAIQKKAVPVK